MNNNFSLFEAEAKLICSSLPGFSLMMTEQDVPMLIGKVILTDGQQNLIDTYEVKILCTEDYPFSFPYVYETDGRIPINVDWHIFPDGHCCISSIPEEMIKCRQGITLRGFIENQVKPYFFNQKYREIHGFFLKERSHGKKGNLEFFTDTFKANDLNWIVRMLYFIKDHDEPDRVAKCFCNSGNKYRKCHREAFRLLKPLPRQMIEQFISFLS